MILSPLKGYGVPSMIGIGINMRYVHYIAGSEVRGRQRPRDQPPRTFEGCARSRLLRMGDSFMRSPEECAREPGAWIVRGLYKLAQWSRADRSYSWELSHAGRVIARCEKYGEAVAALAAHQAKGVV